MSDTGPKRDPSDDMAMLNRILDRYYNHIEDLQIPDVERRCQLALDLGYLMGFAMRSLSLQLTLDLAREEFNRHAKPTI